MVDKGIRIFFPQELKKPLRSCERKERQVVHFLCSEYQGAPPPHCMQFAGIKANEDDILF